LLQSHSFIYHRRCIILATEAFVKQGTGKALRHSVLTQEDGCGHQEDRNVMPPVATLTKLLHR